VDETAEEVTDERLMTLAKEFGDAQMDNSPSPSDDENDAASTSTPNRAGRRGPRNQSIHVPAEWAEDEENIEQEIVDIISNPKYSEMIFDPNSHHHAAIFSMAEKRSKKHAANFEKANPRKLISDSETILEDEFANDPEVQNCLLSPEDVEKKEKVWVNENKVWLRTQQLKQYQKRMEANGPPKRTRNRKKAVRIGELQTSPASSAGEAATNFLKKRAMSKKINYQNIESLFDDMDAPGGGALGSAATSRVTSRAGSSLPESPAATESVANDQDIGMGKSAPKTLRPEIPTAKPAARAPRSPPAAVGQEIVSDDDDYVNDDQQGEPEDRESEAGDTWMGGMRNRGMQVAAEDEEGFESDVEADEVEDMMGNLDDMDQDGDDFELDEDDD